MELSVILNTIVWPTVLSLLGVVLVKYVVPWLKKQAAQTDNEILKHGATIAVSAVEELASNAKKAGDEWGSDKKQSEAEKDLTEFAKSKGIPVSPEDVTKLVKSVLGEKKL